jgi:isopenicillin-N epimerase
VREIVRGFAERGIDVLIDGAHAPGMLPLDLDGLGAAYYTGNCHKWLCAPKGAAFLAVRADRRDRVHPLTISHGLTRSRPGRSRFHDEFDWTGTDDPSAFLAVPTAIDVVGSLLEGGWPAVRRANHDLAVAGRERLLAALAIDAPCPADRIGALATVPLPDATDSTDPPPDSDPLRAWLLDHHRIELPVFPWPGGRHRACRISAQLYNDITQYERLAAILRGIYAKR